MVTCCHVVSRSHGQPGRCHMAPSAHVHFRWQPWRSASYSLSAVPSEVGHRDPAGLSSGFLYLWCPSVPWCSASRPSLVSKGASRSSAKASMCAVFNWHQGASCPGLAAMALPPLALVEFRSLEDRTALTDTLAVDFELLWPSLCAATAFTYFQGTCRATLGCLYPQTHGALGVPS